MTVWLSQTSDSRLTLTHLVPPSSFKETFVLILVAWHFRCVAYLCNGLDRGSVFDQQLHHFHSVLLTGYVQWSESILSSNVKHSKG